MSKLDFLPEQWRDPARRAVARSINVYHGCSWVLRPKTTARGVENSALIDSMGDECCDRDELIDLAVRLIQETRTVDLSDLCRRESGITEQSLSRVLRWPGEHYRLLTAVARVLSPRLVVEVGTFTGLSALAILAGLGGSGKLVSYDLKEWNTFKDTALSAKDFGPNFEQRIGDLSDEGYFAAQKEIMLNADVFFIDGPKNRTFEPKFTELLIQCRSTATLLIFDDIRLLNMIEFWRTIPLPKLDFTSFGHWTGTGFVALMSAADLVE